MVSTNLSRYRIIQALVIGTLIVGIYFHTVWVAPRSDSSLELPSEEAPLTPPVSWPIQGIQTCFSDNSQHPIEQLTCNAKTKYQDLLETKTTGVAHAAQAYRHRRGRHPPPGFDKWVEFATSKNALMIEELFDQIYNDLEPFWGMPADYIRRFSRSYDAVISIRNGATTRFKTIPFQFRDSLSFWMDMIAHIPSENLPDVDMAFNLMDEPHSFVAWEDVNGYMDLSRATKHTRQSTFLSPIINDYSKYDPLPEDRNPNGHTFPVLNREDTIWGHAQKACPPDSKARNLIQDADMTTPARFPTGGEPHFHRGFVSNWTSAQNACDNPYLANIHGTYIGMQTLDEQSPTNTRNGYVWTQLVPLFSYCKINGVNQDILVPAVVYYPMHDKGKDGFTLDEESHIPWYAKSDRVTWYGTASGGVSNGTTWTRFHRHRLVSMLNGTQVTATEIDLDNHLQIPPAHVPGGHPPLPHNFPVPDPSIYDIAATKFGVGELGQWIRNFAQGFMIDLRCTPIWGYFGTNSANCPYSGPFYDVVQPISHTDHFKSKYLPDLDGASFSGRYLSLLSSESVPIKATIYSEWHDSRLIPWQHFVPMDNSFVDLWGIEEYFLGFSTVDGHVVKPGHDEEARLIGQQGADWVKVALRREDMIIYMYRLILEFARISDDRRVDMGYADDLL